MGLDMYLWKINNHAIKYKEYDVEIDQIKVSNPKLYAEMQPYIVKQGSAETFTWESLFEKIGYWRKANQVHNWFVENAQSGYTDCGEYSEVDSEQLEELLAICQEVLKKTVVIIARIQSGTETDTNGRKKKIYSSGKKILNPEVPNRLLPTQDGFFFGGTDYDEYYIQDITDTVELLQRVLNETDFSTHSVYYSASW